MKATGRVVTIVLAALLAALVCTAAAEDLNFNVAMPSLDCGKTDTPNECLLTGEMMVRGPSNLVKPVKYYCDIRYNYAAAGSEQQEIRFKGRLLHRGEITLKNGKARKSLSETVTLELSKRASKVELESVSCYSE